jgi:DNA ligase-associated metallophosphoesterase
MHERAAGIRRIGDGTIEIAGRTFVADVAGALFCESERLLAVADLHFEKGSSYAQRRVFLPPYDTAATLARLTQLAMRYRPRIIISLGDSFHDWRAGARMHATDLAALDSLRRGREWIWITGNHDPLVPDRIGGESAAEFRLGPIVFRHEPKHGKAAGEIAGHLHPVARVHSTAGSTRRRCFVTDGARCVMPAFGAFTGGLNVHDAAFAPLFSGGRIIVHALGRDRVHAVRGANCLPD